MCISPYREGLADRLVVGSGRFRVRVRAAGSCELGLERQKRTRLSRQTNVFSRKSRGYRVSD